MQKLTLITICLALLCMFAACADSNYVFSPDKESEVQAKSGAPQTLSLELQPIDGETEWELHATLTLNGNGQYKGSGTFEFPVLGGIVIVPILGVMQMEQSSSYGFNIDFFAEGEQLEAGRVQLTFQGSATQDPDTGVTTGTGGVTGKFDSMDAADLAFQLQGPAQIIIPDTAF